MICPASITLGAVLKVDKAIVTGLDLTTFKKLSNLAGVRRLSLPPRYIPSRFISQLPLKIFVPAMLLLVVAHMVGIVVIIKR